MSQSTAEALGLERIDLALRGRHDGVGVAVWHSGSSAGVDAGGNYRGDTRATCVEARFEIPLRIGFSIPKRSFNPKNPRPVLEQLEVSGTHRPDLLQVLDAANLESVLRSSGLSVQLLATDTLLRSVVHGWMLAPSRIADHLALVSAMVASLTHARSLHPASWESPLIDSWARVGSAWGLSLDRRRLELRGTVRGHRVYATIGPRGYKTHLRTTLPEPLGCSLVLAQYESMDSFEKLWRRFDDLRFGDAVFDDAYQVKGTPIARVQEVLHPAARAALMALLRASEPIDGAISVDDSGVELVASGLLLSPDVLDRTLKALFTAADALSPDVAKSGPFR